MKLKVGDSRLSSRYWSKVKQAKSGCWEWTASTNHAGYGKYWVNALRECIGAHRVAYHVLVAAVPDDMFVCHRCDNPPCVNPAHLFVGTADDNNRDCRTKGRAEARMVQLAESAQRMREKTHCPHGHLYEGDNLFVTRSGKRRCRTCMRAQVRKSYAANAEKRKQSSREYHAAHREERNRAALEYYRKKKGFSS